MSHQDERHAAPVRAENSTPAAPAAAAPPGDAPPRDAPSDNAPPDGAAPDATPAAAEIAIEKLVYGGDGLGRWPGGKAAFIPFTLPGEQVRAVRETEKPGYLRARVAEILAPAPERVPPRCEYFLRCGGCQLQHAAPERQLELKREVLRETLARTGGVAWEGEIGLHASPPWGYRNRVRLRWGPGGLGYYARDSHAVVAVAHCPIASPALDAAIRALAAAGVAPPAARELELAADGEDRAIMAAVTFAGLGLEERAFAAGLMERIPGCVSVVAGAAEAGPAGEGRHPRGARPAAAAAKKQETVIAGTGSLMYAVGDYGYRVSPGSFFQANRLLLPELAAAVTRGAEGVPTGGEQAVDLFSGVGLFALPLAARFAQVSAVENGREAARDLRFNAGAAENLRVFAEPAEAYLRRRRGPLDLLVADPPRTGLGAKLVAAVAAAQPRRMHYLSCDPATLARDLRALAAALPLEIESIELFDLFPQTFHVETLVRLRLRS